MSVIAFIIGKTIADSIWAMLIMLPVSLPAILLVVTHHLFRRHNLVRRIYQENLIFLEIKIPRELNKSPRAMELALTAFYQTSQGNWYTKYFQGRFRRWASLELISMEGSIHFVIGVNPRYRNIIESHLYAHYPDIEIREIDDYTVEVDYLEHPEKWTLFGMEMVMKKPSCFPFKTYVDFGLDKDPKEEFKNDPLLGVFEALGSIGPGEYIWIQMLICAVLDDEGKMKKMAEAEVKKLVKKEKKVSSPNDLFKTIMDKPTPGETILAEAIERKMMKPMYDVGLRTFYVAKKENFKSPTKYQILIPFRAFNFPGGNEVGGSADTDSRSPMTFEGGWYPKAWRIPKIARQLFDGYRKRSWFYPPYQRTRMQMNAEEIASFYHFPGRVAETPTLARIESKRGEPPVNLPT